MIIKIQLMGILNERKEKKKLQQENTNLIIEYKFEII